MTLTRYLSGKSGQRYEFTFHAVGRELAAGLGLYALFPISTAEAVAASAIYGDGSPATGDDSGLPLHIAASDDLAREVGPHFLRSPAFGAWQAGDGAAVYVWRASGKASRDATLLDLWGAYPRARSVG